MTMSSAQQSMYASRSAASHAATRRMKTSRRASPLIGTGGSARALHETVDEPAQPVAHPAVESRRARERLGRLRRVGARDGHRRVDDFGHRDQVHGSAYLWPVELASEEGTQLFRARERVDHRQRVDAFVHVVAGRLAELFVGASDIE